MYPAVILATGSFLSLVGWFYFEEEDIFSGRRRGHTDSAVETTLEFVVCRGCSFSEILGDGNVWCVYSRRTCQSVGLQGKQGGGGSPVWFHRRSQAMHAFFILSLSHSSLLPTGV